MSTPLLGTIYLSAINFAPRGYSYCYGQTMSIQQNAALYALLGVSFGGDAVSNFLLPDLRGRVPVGIGTATANQYGTTSPYTMGQRLGVESTTLTAAQMPAHTHSASAATTTTVSVANTNGNANAPATGGYLANGYVTPATYLTKTYVNNPSPTPPMVALASQTAASSTNVTVNPNTGGGSGVPVRQPVLALAFLIVIEGMFPARN